MSYHVAIQVYWKARHRNLVTRLHGLSDATARRESIVTANTVSTPEHRRALGHSRTGEGGLEHLFDFELDAVRGKRPDISAEDREGVFVTNSVGTVKGEKIRGKIRMSFFAIDCAYLLVQGGVDPGPGQHLYKENDGGVIETEDGAKIVFDTKGYGLRGADPANPKKWRLAMTVQFSTSDDRYRWLNTSFGFWEGEFDEETGRARYKGYVPRYD